MRRFHNVSIAGDVLDQETRDIRAHAKITLTRVTFSEFLHDLCKHTSAFLWKESRALWTKNLSSAHVKTGKQEVRVGYSFLRRKIFSYMQISVIYLH